MTSKELPECGRNMYVLKVTPLVFLAVAMFFTSESLAQDAATQSAPAAELSAPLSRSVLKALQTITIEAKIAPPASAGSKPDAKPLTKATVVLHAILSTAGEIEESQFISGPPSLAQSAMDAAKRTAYHPYLIHNQPVEVETTIKVNFSIGKPHDPATPSATGPSESIPVSSAVMARLLILPVQPSFPDGVRPSGVWLLHVTISRSGTVEKAEFVSGPKNLADSFVAAVRQWTYAPYLVHGAAMEVQTNILFELPAGVDPAQQVGASLAELTDQQLLDQAAAESQNGDQQLTLYSLRALLNRYPDQVLLRKLPAATQALLDKASIRLLSLEASLDYEARTGVHLKTVGGSVSAPHVTHQVEPDFSPRFGSSISASVMVNFVVDEQGVPQSVRVVRSGGKSADQKVLDAVKRYKFKPAMEDGKPVPVMLNIEVNYSGS